MTFMLAAGLTLSAYKCATLVSVENAQLDRGKTDRYFFG